MVVYDFNPSSRNARQVDLCELEASLVYTVVTGQPGPQTDLVSNTQIHRVRQVDSTGPSPPLLTWH